VADLHVVAVIKAKAGQEEAIGDALRSIVAPSRLDAGCIRYDLFQAQGAPGTFVNLETWASQEDLSAHMKSPHLGAAFASTGDALDGRPQIYLLSPVDVCLPSTDRSS
jgi:quinol monooxygenase YgiN